MTSAPRRPVRAPRAGALALAWLVSASCGTMSDQQLLDLAARGGVVGTRAAKAGDSAREAAGVVPTHLDDHGATRHVAALAGRFDSARMLEVVSALEALRREGGNEDYDRAIDLVLARLEAGGFGREQGLELQVLSSEPRPTWNGRSAKLELVDGERVETLMAFDSSDDRDRLLLPTFAPSAAVEGPIVARLEDATPGCVLVGAEPLDERRLSAAKERGVALVVSAHLAEFNVDPSGGARHEHAVGYRSVAHPAPLPVAQVSPRVLARLVKKSGQIARFGAVAEVVERPVRTVLATVVGDLRGGEEVAVVAHVQEPGACDNASGVAAALDMADAAAGLARQGARPSRSLVFVFGDEMHQSRVHLAATRRVVVAAIAADMLGESPERTGAKALLEREPDPGAWRMLAPDQHTAWGSTTVEPAEFGGGGLAVVLRQAFHAVAAKEPGWSFGEHPYEGGSDHVVYLRAKVPAALVWHFPDWTYHTSLDRLDMVDAEELRRSATVVLAAALCVADARARDLDGLLRAARAATNLRVERARAAGDEELERAWLAHELDSRDQLRRWCLGLDTPLEPRKPAGGRAGAGAAGAERGEEAKEQQR
ncbi:MAG: hypothetical protein RL112_262 [Planctomycetota bacterium]